MIRIIVKYLVFVGLLAVVPTMALAERQTITLASNVPGNNLYVDGNGCLRDPSVKVTHYEQCPPAYYGGPAADYPWPDGVRPPLVTHDAYATGHLGWAWASLSEADWINWTCTNYSQGMSYYMGADYSGPYHADYEISFTMPAFFRNAAVEIQYSADDWMNAYMNGQLFVDQHTPVIDLYFKGVPPPPGFCSFSCISTTTVADAAPFLVPGVNKFTLRQWEPDGIGGALFLVKITYDPFDPLQALLATLEQLRTAVASLPAGVFKNANQQNALLNQIDAELKIVKESLYLEARDKLSGDILAKMDGFAVAGAVDATDWIYTTNGQSATYPLAVRALVLLNSLL